MEPGFAPYWHRRDLPPGTRIDEWGVARVPSGFYDFEQAVQPLANATSLREIEDYPLPDMAAMDFSLYPSVASQAAPCLAPTCGAT